MDKVVLKRLIRKSKNLFYQWKIVLTRSLHNIWIVNCDLVKVDTKQSGLLITHYSQRDFTFLYQGLISESGFSKLRVQN